MKIAYTALEELSVHVVPIAQELTVMPIVSAIDTFVPG
jgi:rsbT co-antagonist protein RsbR